MKFITKNSKAYYLIVVLLLSVVLFAGCGKDEKTEGEVQDKSIKEKLQDKKVETINNDLYPLKKGKKWGFVDTSGKWVIEPKLDSEYKGFSKNGLAPVKKNKKWGYINTKGEWIIKPKFDEVCHFKDGLATVSINHKIGYINKEGNWAIKPKFDAPNSSDISRGIWICSYAFNNGFAHVKTNDKWGYIGKNGNWIVRPNTFDYIEFDKNGLAVIEQNKKYGLIDKNGKVLIKPNFEKIYLEDKVIVAFLNNKAGIIDKTGKWIIKPKYDHLYLDEKSGYLVAKLNKKKGCINLQEEWILKPRYEDIKHCPINNLAIASKNNKYGIVNTKGEWIVEPKFKNIVYGSAKNSLFFVRDNNKYGLIDNSGNWIKKPIYEEVDGFYNNGLAIVKINKKYGVIDKKGNWVLKPKFDHRIEFFGNLIRVEYGNNMGYATLDGKYLTFSENDIKNYYADKKLYLNKYLTLKEGSIVYLPLTPEFKRILKTDKDYLKIKIDGCSTKKGYCDGAYEDNKDNAVYLFIDVDKKSKNRADKDLRIDIDVYTKKDHLELNAFYEVFISKNKNLLKKLKLPSSIIGKLYFFHQGDGIMPMAIYIDVEKKIILNIFEREKRIKANWNPPYLIEGTNCVDHDDPRNGEWLNEAYRKGGVLDANGCLLNLNG